MKQKDCTAIPPQATVRSTPGACSSKPSANRANGGATLESAEPVVATPGRKKPAGRIETGALPTESPGVVPEKSGLPVAVDGSVIGRLNADNTGATGAIAADADTRSAVSKQAGAHSGSGNSDAAHTGERAPRTKGAPDFINPRPPGLRAGPDKAEPEASTDMHGAVAFDAKGKGKEVTPEKATMQRDRRRTDPDAEIGRLPQAGEEVPPERSPTAGIGDRVPYLAMVAGAATPTLRPPKMARTSSVKPLRPKSRADCQRRCGSDGFCDPSSELGCGGVHCGRKYDGV